MERKLTAILSADVKGYSRLMGEDEEATIIAARLESLAEPGGICISGTVYDHVENKLALTYEYLGQQTVKNIAKPVRVYRPGAGGSRSPGGRGPG